MFPDPKHQTLRCSEAEATDHAGASMHDGAGADMKVPHPTDQSSNMGIHVNGKHAVSSFILQSFVEGLLHSRHWARVWNGPNWQPERCWILTVTLKGR